MSKIADNILDILGECRVDGNTLYLPEQQLDRKTYESVNKCIENIGGKWNRKAKGHVFDADPSELLDSLILTGETLDMKKQFQFFPTPRKVAEIMCDMADIKIDSFILEPSCGRGDLADVIFERNPGKLFGVELNTGMEKFLTDKPYDTYIGKDFLEFKDGGYWDRIIMNPPFSKQQDIDHIIKAYEILKELGILVSVVSESPFFRTNRKSTEFLEFLDKHGAEIIELPEGAFKGSGTMVRTRIIKIKK